MEAVIDFLPYSQPNMSDFKTVRMRILLRFMLRAERVWKW
jgi:hypothetical protein